MDGTRNSRHETRFTRVRAGSTSRFEALMIDGLHPPYDVRKGDVVRVVNLHGCPKANTMGHAFVELLDGTFGGLVCTKSLKYKGSK